MYAMEISNFTLNKVKGSYGTYDRWFQLSITAGICFSSFLGISSILGHKDRWQWLLFFNIVPVLFNLFLYKCPDSPVYILLQTKDLERNNKAREALKLLCPPNEVDKELERLKKEAFTEDVLTLTKIRELFRKPEFRVGLFLVCFLQIAQQLSGINIVIAYSSFIYQGSGVEIELIEWMVFGTTLMNFFTTPISLSVQEKGRRTVLLFTTGIMGGALFVLFMASRQCENSGNVCPYFAIVPVFAYIVLFSLGLGPIPYIIVQELFEKDAQGAAFNVSVALHWLCNFLVMFCFRSLQMSMESYVYLMFSGIVLVLCGIMYKILPETKNKTMTEIKNSKEYKFVLKWLSIQASETTDNQSSNSATEEVRLLHVT
ncbi:solute carrier family 2, facilitated glucose transporter member 1-like [Mytilus trossulus]|uniref:solute carrier family 2, facilitated glucose transporter member 1-like n=1 Tax=Mytilus trossulus TaxID=6551 RepID=UPI003007C06A